MLIYKSAKPLCGIRIFDYPPLCFGGHDEITLPGSLYMSLFVQGKILGHFSLECISALDMHLF